MAAEKKIGVFVGPVENFVGSQKQDAVMQSLSLMNEIAILYKLNMCRINKSSKQK